MRRRRRLPSTPAILFVAPLCWLFLAGPVRATGEEPLLDWDRLAALEAAEDWPAALELLDDAAPAAAGAMDSEWFRWAGARQRALAASNRFRDVLDLTREWIERARDRASAREVVLGLNAAGQAHFRLGDRDDALAAFESAVQESVDPEVEPPLQVRSRVLAAEALLNKWRFADARRHLRDAERIADPKDLEQLADILSMWGVLHLYRKELDEAEEAWNRVLALREGHADDAPVAHTLLNLSQVSIARHDYAEGIGHLRRALALGVPPGRRDDYLISLGICHYELNQLDEAETVWREALRVATETGDAYGTAWASGELGLAAAARDDWDEALRWYDRAIAGHEEVGDLRNVPSWLQNKGVVYRDTGRHREALEQYRLAREIRREAGGTPPWWLQKHEGQSWAALGEIERARELLHAVITDGHAHGDRKIVWEAERELARLLRRSGELDGAVDAYSRALDAIEDVRSTLRLESFKRDFLSDKVAIYAEAIDLLVEESESEEGVARAFRIAERARARAFLDTLAESRTGLHETLPEEVQEEERLLLDRLSELQRRARRGDADDAAEAEIEGLERDLEALHLEIRDRFPRFRSMRSLDVASADDVRAALGPGEAVFATFLAEGASHAWLIRPQGIRSVRLPDRTAIERAVRSAFASLAAPGEVPDLAELGEMLLGPWWTAGSGIESLVLIPSGILHFLPFETLPLGAGGLLGDRVATAYAPSATTWLELRNRPRDPRTPRLLALGDALDGDTADRLRSARDLAAVSTLGALPYSRREVEEVAALFGRGGATVLLGEEATEGRFKARHSGHSVVHLATHGWIDPAVGSASGLVLRPEDGDAPEDGILQLREIVRLDLDADLVVLSACESGLGELVTGEGMVGLARGFFYAGAESVVATLWSVDDATTARFMTAFYRELRSGASKAEALRRTRTAFREDPATAHPFYWAPYVLLGRGDDTVDLPRRGPGPRLAALAALVAAVLALAFAARRRS